MVFFTGFQSAQLRIFMDIFDFSDGREGYYGEYGGVFLPEILQATIEELLECFRGSIQVAPQ